MSRAFRSTRSWRYAGPACCTTSAGSPSPRGSGRKTGRWPPLTGSRSGCIPTTRSACWRPPRSSSTSPASAAHHHERLDGSGYHRGATAATLTGPQRLLAAADAFRAKTEPRAYRAAGTFDDAAAYVQEQSRAGRLDPEAVHAVVEAAGMRPEPVVRPAGLTDREAQVIGLLARGLQTKQIARALGVSAKTADRHIQNSYAKIGVSTRAAATVFAMQHGLVAWGELPMVGDRSGS